jgi:hypothetical protein
MTAEPAAIADPQHQRWQQAIVVRFIRRGI